MTEQEILDIVIEQQRTINFLRDQLLKTVEAATQLTEVSRDLNRKILALDARVLELESKDTVKQ